MMNTTHHGRPHASRHASRLRRRAGMSLVELVVALGLLGGALLALANFSIKFSHASTISRIQSTAVALAADRLENVKSYNNYAGIDTAFSASEPSIAGYPGYSRRTVIQHVGGVPADSVDDYRVITVIVSHPQLTAPVKKTTFIAAF